MKNGFTLIELLGVIIILTILMALVFPNMINLIKSSSEKSDNLNLKLIYNATEMYIKGNKNDFPKNNGNVYCISLSDLVDYGVLKSPVKLTGSDTDVTQTKSVQVSYNNSFTYELKDTLDCVEQR